MILSGTTWLLLDKHNIYVSVKTKVDYYDNNSSDHNNNKNDINNTINNNDNTELLNFNSFS